MPKICPAIPLIYCHDPGTINTLLECDNKTWQIMVWILHNYDVSTLGVVHPILTKKQLIQYHLFPPTIAHRGAGISSKVFSCPISLSIASTTTARIIPIRTNTVNLVFSSPMKSQAGSALLLWNLIVCLLESLEKFSRRWFSILVFLDGDHFQVGKLFEEFLNIFRASENICPC